MQGQSISEASFPNPQPSQASSPFMKHSGLLWLLLFPSQDEKKPIETP